MSCSGRSTIARSCRITVAVRRSAASPSCRYTCASILIALPSDDEAGALDELLWTFHDRAFVPHHRCGEAQCSEPELPVHVCVDLDRSAERRRGGCAR